MDRSGSVVSNRVAVALVAVALLIILLAALVIASVGLAYSIEDHSSSNQAKQAPVQYQDEGVNLGTAGTVNTVNLVGRGLTATRSGDTVTVTEVSVQYQDEGVNLGTAGTVDTINYVGTNVTATRMGNTVTITVGAAPSPYSLDVAQNDVATTPTVLTLSNSMLFGGDIAEGSLAGAGTPTFTAGHSDLGNQPTHYAAVASLYSTLFALSGLVITSPLETNNIGFGAGVFVPGVYTIAGALNMTATTTVTLNGAGDYVFIAQGAGAITFGATDSIVLTGGAVASRVFWVAGGAITTGAGDVLKGNLMTGATGPGAITLGAANNVEGRLLSKGAITINGTSSALYLPLA